MSYHDLFVLFGLVLLDLVSVCRCVLCHLLKCCSVLFVLFCVV